jgi:hypothetical protein
MGNFFWFGKLAKSVQLAIFYSTKGPDSASSRGCFEVTIKNLCLEYLSCLKGASQTVAAKSNDTNENPENSVLKILWIPI